MKMPALEHMKVHLRGCNCQYCQLESASTLWYHLKAAERSAAHQEGWQAAKTLLVGPLHAPDAPSGLLGPLALWENGPCLLKGIPKKSMKPRQFCCYMMQGRHTPTDTAQELICAASKQLLISAGMKHIQLTCR